MNTEILVRNTDEGTFMRTTYRRGIVVLASAMLLTSVAGAQTSGRTVATVENMRPNFHFTPPTNWTNDPNGMVWYAGEWHLFYQHNPFGNTWGHMSWGHAVSKDLVHWQHLPVAIAEENGAMIFSGSAVVDAHNSSGFCKSARTTAKGADASCLVAIYTSSTETNQSQHVAYSNDRGRSWTRYPGNPVIDINEKDFRDPKVFWHAPTKRWVMVVSLAQQHKIRLYTSSDLKAWTQVSEFGPAGEVGGVWECPDLFELHIGGPRSATRWVLVVNINPGAPAGGSGAQYFIGTFDGTTFTADEQPTSTRWADYGKDFYAAVSWNGVPSSDGRRIWLGWMSNWEYANQEPTSPFRGAMTIPRVLSLRPAGTELVLVQQPIAELQQLRTNATQLTNVALRDGVDVLAGRAVAGDAMEIEVNVVLGDASTIALAVRQSADEVTTVGYDVAKKELFVDRTRSGQHDFSTTFTGRHAAPMTVTGKRLKLRVFVDKSSVEVFGDDGRTVITDRIFPRNTSVGVSLRAIGGTATLTALRAWNLRAAPSTGR